MAASISAVAAICATAPSSTHGQNTAGGGGNACPPASTTARRNSAPNGRPNRKRTWGAPAVGGGRRSERRGELALGGVAHGLARRRDHREQRPEPACVEHHAAFSAATI